jgi:hypothetical protein
MNLESSRPKISLSDSRDVDGTGASRCRVSAAPGTIDHVVNGLGGPADTSSICVPVYIVEYP